MKDQQTDIEKQLIDIVQQLLVESEHEYAQRKITIDFSLQRHLGIDSFGRAELFQRIEKKFDVHLPDNLLASAETLKDIVNAIDQATPGYQVRQQEKFQSPLAKSFIDPSQTKTLLDVLLLYAKGDPDRPHIYLQDEQGHEETITYHQLYVNSLRVAHSLLNRGLSPGDTVAIMQPTNPGFFYTFFGTLFANCIPVPIYPPFRPNQIEAYAKQEAKILKNAQARILVTFHEAEQLSKLLRAFVPSLKAVTTVNSLLKDEQAPVYEFKSDDFALIQYTSGSTSTPKGVLLTHRNLLTNIRAYGKAIELTHQDVAVSWVPLYHDLGLIGMWLGSLYHGIPLTLMSPLTFLNRPERWLWAMHYHRGTISGGPNFAYELCVRKVDKEMITGLDLSAWRIAFNGAEAIQPKTLQRFTEKFAPYGFKPETHLPVYGLAESSVCLAISDLHRIPKIDRIVRKSFEEQLHAVPTEDTKEQNSLEFVTSGRPLPEHQVRIVDDNNKTLPDRHVGHLQFRGPSAMQGYYGNPEATLAIYHDGWWDSGDLAYLAEGEIFVTGRSKDVIIKAGRNLYPAEVEELASQVNGIRKGCVIAFGTTDAARGTEKLVVVAETRDKKPAHPNAIIEHITEKVVNALDVAPDQIILVPPQTIPKTSSGKLQRAACKNLYLTGKLGKRRVPAWIQFAKIGMSSFGIKLKRYISNGAKCIFTLYAAIIFAITFIPVYISLFIFSRNSLAYICKYWARFLFLLLFSPIKIVHPKNLYRVKPSIFTANHASYVDALLLLAILPAGTRFIGKEEVNQMPFVRHFMRKLEFITVNRTDFLKGLEDSKEIESALQNGFSIVIFPEGTFSYAAGLRPFKLGAFKIAAETESAICPVAIQGTRAMLRGQEKLIKPHFIKVTVSPPILAMGKNWHEITQLKNQVRAIIAKNCGEPSLDLITPDIAKE